MRHHFYACDWGDDGDYVVFCSRGNDGQRIEHMRWMIPGTWMGD